MVGSVLSLSVSERFCTSSWNRAVTLGPLRPVPASGEAGIQGQLLDPPPRCPAPPEEGAG